jgi:hypothetical protein
MHIPSAELLSIVDSITFGWKSYYLKHVNNVLHTLEIQNKLYFYIYLMKEIVFDLIYIDTTKIAWHITFYWSIENNKFVVCRWTFFWYQGDNYCISLRYF